MPDVSPLLVDEVLRFPRSVEICYVELFCKRVAVVLYGFVRGHLKMWPLYIERVGVFIFCICEKGL